MIADVLRKYGVPCKNLSDFEGFVDHDFHEKEELAGEIEKLRKARDTYKHERQVRTEAEIVVIVKALRDAKYKLVGKSFQDAYFVSHTRVLDQLKGANTPTTIQPSALLHWINALVPTPMEETAILFDGFMLELSQRGFSVVDRVTAQKLLAR